MPETCVRCGIRRGSRSCPALAGVLCSRCCGTQRLVKVACPTGCPHLEAHEAFQRTRQKERYREVWARINRDLRERKERLELLVELECAVKRAAAGLSGSKDTDVAEGIADVLSRLSQIEIVSRAPTPLGRLLSEEVGGLLEQRKVSRDDVKDALTRLGRMVDALQEPGAPRAFLQGLSARLEGLPDRASEPQRTGLILTPGDLRRAS